MSRTKRMEYRLARDRFYDRVVRGERRRSDYFCARGLVNWINEAPVGDKLDHAPSRIWVCLSKTAPKDRIATRYVRGKTEGDSYRLEDRFRLRGAITYFWIEWE